MMRRRLLYRESGIIPSLYKQVEYLTSQPYAYTPAYLNTGILPNDNMRILCTGRTLQSSLSSTSFIFGSRKSTHIQRFWFVSFQNYFSAGYGNTHNTHITTNADRDFSLDFNYNSNHQIKCNNDIITPTFLSNVFEYPIYLFGLNAAGNLDGQHAQTNISTFTIYNNYTDDSPIMNLIPCYRKSDNKPGFYDTVSKQFKTSDGGADFILPV